MQGTYSFAEGIFLVCIGFLPYIWDHSEVAASYLLSLSSYTESPTEIFKEIVVTWIFLILTTLIDTVTKLPFSLYR
jgi:hypothetical protein